MRFCPPLTPGLGVTGGAVESGSGGPGNNGAGRASSFLAAFANSIPLELTVSPRITVPPHRGLASTQAPPAQPRMGLAFLRTPPLVIGPLRSQSRRPNLGFWGLRLAKMNRLKSHRLSRVRLAATGGSLPVP